MNGQMSGTLRRPCSSEVQQSILPVEFCHDDLNIREKGMASWRTCLGEAARIDHANRANATQLLLLWRRDGVLARQTSGMFML